MMDVKQHVWLVGALIVIVVFWGCDRTATVNPVVPCHVDVQVPARDINCPLQVVPERKQIPLVGGRPRKSYNYTFVQKHVKDFFVYKHPQKDHYPKPVDLIYYQIAACMHSPNMVFLDIGANVGQFVESIFGIWGRQRYRSQLQEWKTRGVKIQPARFLPDVTAAGDPLVHVFEPMPSNFKALSIMKDRYPDGHVFLNHAAVSNTPGTMPMYDGGQEGEDTGNTQGGLLAKGKVVSNVTVTTIDEYVAKNKLPTLDVVKIDVEGFEFEVFEGMIATVRAGKLKLFTFEYGEKWTAPRPHYPKGVRFHDALALLDGWGFDSFVVGFHCWVQLNGVHYHPYYEDRTWDTGLLSVEVVSVHRDHPKYDWLTAPVDWCSSTP